MIGFVKRDNDRSHKGLKLMRTDINYTCDDCHEKKAVFKSYKKARAAGWAIAGNYKNCYCPECAPPHRLGGANGKSKPPRIWLPEGFEQLKLEIK